MIVDVAEEDAELLARFYHELYLPAFAAQREPLEAWQRALAGEQPYRMFVRLVVEGGEIRAGITYELYPESACGFITYVVVAEAARRAGVGRRILFDAVGDLVARGARAVFGEVKDPRVCGDGHGAAWERLARFQRWGCRVVDVRYVQPSLGPGLPRDRGLVLIVHPPIGAIDGATVRGFVRELHALTEGCEPDDEVQSVLDGIGETVALIELAR